MDASRNRKEKVAFSNENGYVWTRPKLLKAQNVNIDSKRFSRKQNVSPDNVFSFKQFTCNTQETYLFVPSRYFVIYQQFLRYHCRALQKHDDLWSKIQLTFTFFASVIHSDGPFRKRGLSSEGSKGRVCRL